MLSTVTVTGPDSALCRLLESWRFPMSMSLVYMSCEAVNVCGPLASTVPLSVVMVIVLPVTFTVLMALPSAKIVTVAPATWNSPDTWNSRPLWSLWSKHRRRQELYGGAVGVTNTGTNWVS